MKKSRKGFTLAELLIVIAIIGVLVAISIPIFTTQKKKAVFAVNQANARAAYAAAMAEMNSNPPEHVGGDNYPAWLYVYDTKIGTIIYSHSFNYGLFQSPQVDDINITLGTVSYSRKLGWLIDYKPRSADISSWDINNTYWGYLNTDAVKHKLCEKNMRYWGVGFSEDDSANGYHVSRYFCAPDSN